MRKGRTLRWTTAVAALVLLFGAATATLALDPGGKPRETPPAPGARSTPVVGHPTPSSTKATPRLAVDDLDRDDDDAHDANTANTADSERDGAHDGDHDDSDTSDATVVSRGACSAKGTWKVQLEPDDGSLELELEVDGVQTRGSWHVQVSRGDKTLYSTDTIADGSGELEVEAKVPSASGADAVTFSAWEAATGQTCTAKVSG